MRRLFVGIAFSILLVSSSFADKAPPPPPTIPAPKPAPKPTPKPEVKPIDNPQNCDLILSDFMETKIKATVSDETLTKEQIDARLAVYYKDLLKMVPDPKWNEGLTSWKKLVEKTIDKKSWGSSCKSCHKAFESKYEKAHHDKKICFTIIP